MCSMRTSVTSSAVNSGGVVCGPDSRVEMVPMIEKAGRSGLQRSAEYGGGGVGGGGGGAERGGRAVRQGAAAERSLDGNQQVGQHHGCLFKDHAGTVGICNNVVPVQRERLLVRARHAVQDVDDDRNVGFERARDVHLLGCDNGSVRAFVKQNEQRENGQDLYMCADPPLSSALVRLAFILFRLQQGEGAVPRRAACVELWGQKK